jgi:hypothetical protein
VHYYISHDRTGGAHSTLSAQLAEIKSLPTYIIIFTKISMINSDLRITYVAGYFNSEIGLHYFIAFLWKNLGMKTSGRLFFDLLNRYL